MSRFLSNPTIYPYKATDTGRWAWAVDKPLGLELGPRGSGWELWTDEGFTSDLGSIPLLIRPLINPADPQCARSWLMHDWCNRLTGKVMPYWLEGFSSQFAVGVLADCLALDGVPRWSRIAQYFAVSAGISEKEWVVCQRSA